MAELTLDKLLGLLDVQLEAFAMCEIERNAALACPPLPSVLVHFVMDGEGAIDCEHGRYTLRRGDVIIIPKQIAKRIEGPAPVVRVAELDLGCPLAPGMVTYRAAAGGKPGLVLGCGSVAIGMGGMPGLLDSLDRPLLHPCEGGPLSLMFEAMAAELRRPLAGTKAMVEALMRQILVVVLRRHHQLASAGAPVHLLARNAQLGRALHVIATKPGEPHTVDSLAAMAGMSRSCFYRKFTSTYGCTPMEHLQSVRLRAAARLLVGSDLPVKSVAATVGYASRSHFSRAFTERFGSDPSRYRSSGGAVDAARQTA